MAAKKIMLVEDEADLLALFKIKLQAEGFAVVFTTESARALELARAEKPDLILLDLIMPEMDGYAVLRAIRKDAQLKDALVYVWSNLTQEKEIALAKKDGADGFFIKSDYTPTQLADKVKEILKLK